MKACRSCSYWAAIEERLARDDGRAVGQKAQLGHCRRQAPQVLMLTEPPAAGAAGPQTCWPLTASDDWCGEWSPNYG